jgi:hypothetical protein
MRNSRKKRHNQKRRKTVKLKWLENNQLTRLGSGSYGTIYIVSNGNKVMKEHMLTRNSDETCSSWEKEFNTQLYLYNICNPILERFGVQIVKPYAFYYSKKVDRKRIVKRNSHNATSCFFTMQRLPGRIGSTNIKNRFEQKLSSILRPDVHFYKGDWVPPYMFLSSIRDEDGPIFLHMLQGVELKPLFKDEIQYCNVDINGIGFNLIRSMIASFFIILSAGYMPRDIEYVFNGTCADNIYVSILDCNEVKTIKERAESYGQGYDICEDIAHVYIDLAGLRANTQPNPMAPYDLPTPQWKFLCSPLTAPGAFIQCIQSLTDWLHESETTQTDIDYRQVFKYILLYVRRNYFDGIKHQISTELYDIFTLRPVNIYTIPDGTSLPEHTRLLGFWTDQEFTDYYKSLSYFNKNNDWSLQLHDDRRETYIVGLPQFRAELYSYVNTVILDIDVVFDIEFQQYIICHMAHTLFLRNMLTSANISNLFGKQYDQIITYIDELFQSASRRYNVDAESNCWPLLF